MYCIFDEETPHEKLYAAAYEKIQKLGYSAKDVEAFSIALTESHTGRISEKSRFFPDALINHCPEERFVIHTTHFARPINYIGTQNAKHIVVEGDAGSNLGLKMEGGSILVTGDAGVKVGNSMNGGIITVKGDANSSPGSDMNGGTIIIDGDSGGAIGPVMNDAEIHFNGNYSGGVYPQSTGKIFHKGKKIYPR